MLLQMQQSCLLHFLLYVHEERLTPNPSCFSPHTAGTTTNFISSENWKPHLHPNQLNLHDSIYFIIGNQSELTWNLSES